MLALVCIGVSVGPSRVVASDVTVLVAIRDESSAAVAKRTQAEVEAAGFVIAGESGMLVSGTETDLLVHLMTESEVSALVLLLDIGDARQISVIVTDPESGGDHFRRIDRRAEGSDASVGVQALEVLRAAWAEAGLAQPKSQAPVMESQPSKAPATLASSALVLDSGVTYSPGGIAPSWKLGAVLELYARDWLGAALNVAGTPLSASAQRAGALDLRHASVAAGPVFRLRPSLRTRVWLSPAVGAMSLWTTLPDSPSARTWAPMLAMRLSTGIAFNAHAGLRVSVNAQSFSAPIHIDVDGARVARFGMPVLDASLGLDLTLR